MNTNTTFLPNAFAKIWPSKARIAASARWPEGLPLNDEGAAWILATDGVEWWRLHMLTYEEKRIFNSRVSNTPWRVGVYYPPGACTKEDAKVLIAILRDRK